MSPIVNRRNALLGWAVWTFMRRRANAKAKATVGTIDRAPRRWLRRLGGLLIAGLAALGILAAWRKLRGGGDEEWVTPEPLNVSSTPPEPSPLTRVEPDDDIPPAA